MNVDLADLKKIVGHANMVAGARVEVVNKDTLPRVVTPLAYVYPADVGTLARIMKWARSNGVAVWPSGQGRNWGYGAATPLNEDSIVVILRRINRIIKVDAELAYAEIEPGVTYRQLCDYLANNHPDLWIDAIDGSPNGSVLGNALERGVGPTPYGDHYGQLCGLEVLLPSGETIQTGGLRGSKTWHTYRWGTGPVVDGLFSQSNLGIVVRAGLWLMPRPRAFKSMLFEMNDGARFADMLKAIRELLMEGVIRGAVRLINDMVSLSLFMQYPNPPGKTLTAQQVKDLRKSQGLASWTLSAGIYGSRESVTAQSKRLKTVLSPYGRVEIFGERRVRFVDAYVRYAKSRGKDNLYGRLLYAIPQVVSGKPIHVIESIPHMHGLMKGQPTEYFVRHAYFKMKERPDQDIDPARDGCGVIWIAPLVPNRPSDIEKALTLSRVCYEKWGFEFHVAIIFHNPRTALVLMSIFYFKERPEEREKADGLRAELVAELRKESYQEYRTGISHMDALYSEDPSYESLLRKLKQAIDPEGILAPGRYGVRWAPTVKNERHSG